MGHSPSMHLRRATTTPPDDRHPWVRALDTFAIPFLCYSPEGMREFTSEPAERLTSDVEVGAPLLARADRAVVCQLAMARPRLQIGQFVRVSELRVVAAGVTLSIFLAARAISAINGTCDVGAVVVFHPLAAPMRESSAAIAVSAGAAALTTREEQVASRIAMGLATKEIAAQLGISAHTARHHTERVFAKLGVRSRSALAAILAPRLGNSDMMAL